MTFKKRLLALLMVVLMIVVSAPTVLAATKNVEAQAGKTVQVEFVYNPAYNLSGFITYDDPNGVVDSVKITLVDLKDGMMGRVSDNGVWVVPAFDAVSGKITVRVSVAIKANAATGSRVNVYFNGNYGDATKGIGDDTPIDNETAVITVTRGSASGNTNPGTSNTPSVDYTELQRQIAIANGLNSAEYTADSWDNLLVALSVANGALNSKSQSVVDEAAEELAEAIAALVRIDYSALLAALAEAEAFLKTNELAGLMEQLLDAVERGKALLVSGDPEAVAACAKEITDLLAKIKALIKEMGNGEVIIEKVPVEVVVPPTDDFCNISMHKVWPVLFFCSLALNAILIGFGLVYIKKKRKVQTDETPLVDYDIDYDIDDEQ